MYTEGVRTGNEKKKTAAIEGLMMNIGEWHMDDENHTKQFRDLLKEHTLIVKDLIDGAFTCACDKPLGKGDKSCPGNIKVIESIRLLGINLEKITQTLHYGFPESKLSRFETLWNKHLKCTAGYIDALRKVSSMKDCKYVDKRDMCMEFGEEMGVYLNKVSCN